MAVIFDFGPVVETIRLTAEYSNAVLVAVLPFFSNYAQKLDLPVPHPIAMTDVAQFGIASVLKDGQPIGVSLKLKNEWILRMSFGYMVGFEGPKCYSMLQDPTRVPTLYGVAKMTKEEAITMARKTILKLGVSLESVFADGEPCITGPPIVDGHVVPHYTIQWFSPDTPNNAQVTAEGGLVFDDVGVEVNAEAKRVEMLRISLRAAQQSLPRHLIKVGIDPPVSPSNVEWPAINPAYAKELLPIVFRAVADYSKILGLSVPRPLTTNMIVRFFLADNYGWPHCELELTNGWRFIYRNSMVNGFYAPDNLFTSDNRSIRVKEFLGKSNMTEAEAIELVRTTVEKLKYAANLVHLDFKPNIVKSRVSGIPRYFITWQYVRNDELESKVEAEVDTENPELKSLYYDDKAYWNHPPKIDVPITLSKSSGNNSSSHRPTVQQNPLR